MSKASVGRNIVAVLSSYIVNGSLVLTTEQLLSPSGPDVTPRPFYFVVDLISQCLYTVAAGYLCCAIARPSQRVALVGLIGLALAVGSVSLALSWKSEPHWYGIALLLVYAPCAWLGWGLKGRGTASS